MQLSGDLTRAHAACIRRQNAFVEAGYAALVLGQQLPAKAGIAITGDGDVDLTKVTADGLGRMAVADVAGLVADAAVAGVAQVLGHFGIQCRFKDGPGELL